MKRKDGNVCWVTLHYSFKLLSKKCVKSLIWLKENKSAFNPPLLWFWFHAEDFDDCSMWGVCDQQCEDRIGSHRCSCREGYVLEQHRYCRADISSECHFLSVWTDCLTYSMLTFWMCEWSIQMKPISIASFLFANHCGCFTERLRFFLVHCCVLNVVLVSLLSLWNIERVLTKRLTSLPLALVKRVARKYLHQSESGIWIHVLHSVNFHCILQPRLQKKLGGCIKCK